MNEQMTDVMGGLFKQSAAMMNQAFESGAKFQREATRFWTEAFDKGFDEFRSQTEKATRDAVPAAKKTVERFRSAFDEQNKNGLDAMRRSFDIVENAFEAKAVDNTLGAWQASFGLMRSSFDTLADVQTSAFENWSKVSQSCCSAASAGKNGGKSAK